MNIHRGIGPFSGPFGFHQLYPAMVRLANGITAAWANIAGPLISDLWFPARERTLATATWSIWGWSGWNCCSAEGRIWRWMCCRLENDCLLGFFRPPQRERLVSWVLFAFSDLPHYRENVIGFEVGETWHETVDFFEWEPRLRRKITFNPIHYHPLMVSIAKLYHALERKSRNTQGFDDKICFTLTCWHSLRETGRQCFCKLLPSNGCPETSSPSQYFHNQPPLWGARKDEQLQSSVPPVFSIGFKGFELSWWKGLLSIIALIPSGFL